MIVVVMWLSRVDGGVNVVVECSYQVNVDDVTYSFRVVKNVKSIVTVCRGSHAIRYWW